MSKKWLHTFDVKKDVQKEVKEKSKNDKGEEVTTTTTVTEQEPFTFTLQKPNRKLYEEAELFYAVKLSEGIKAGLLTRPLLAKRYKNDGGAMSEPEKERYAEVYYQMLIKQEELEKLKLNLEGKTEQERAKQASLLMADIIELQEEIQQFESAQSNLFDQTAENRAKNMTIMWWVLHLAHQKNEDDSFVEVFGNGDYDDRLEVYDEIEDKNEPFWTEAVKKFAYFVTFWYLNGISSEEEFKQIENMYNQDVGFEDEEVELAEAEEEAKVEEAKAEEAKAEEAKAEEAKAEEAKAEEAKAEEAKAEESPEEEPKAEELKEEQPKQEEKPKEKTHKKSKKSANKEKTLQEEQG